MHYDGEVRLILHTTLWRQEPNTGRQRQIRILASPFQFRQTLLHTKVWRQESNGGRYRQIQMLTDPFKIDETECSDGCSDVDYDGEVRSTLHTILGRYETNKRSSATDSDSGPPLRNRSN